MGKRIRVLDPVLAGKIAAGEVVERPSSVVKELLENALDAGSTRISITLAEGGKRLIKVTDNGCGISRLDAPLVFLRHSTSKISAEEDLSSIKTLGFRGEALGSISTVSRVEVKTRERGEPSGTSIRVEGGGEQVVSPCGCPEGTEVRVDDLFFNIPARKKFLRSAQSEYAKILDVVKRTALANPSVSFRLVHGASRSMDLQSGGLRERMAELLGIKTPESLVEVKNPYVSGLTGAPDLTFATGEHLYTYVNGRPVRDRAVNRAILDGYGTLLQGRYPMAVLDLKIPHEDVDVNIHPAKTEVRFKNPGAVYHMVRDSVRSALSAGLTSAPAKTSYAAPEVSAVPFAAEATLPAFSFQSGPAPEDAPPKNPEFLRLSPVGQLWGEFLVAEGGGEFYLIDQHGAEERHAFEKLRKDFYGGSIERQALLVPERVEAGASEGVSLREAMPYLEKFGFEVVPFGPGPAGGETFAIKSVPALLSGRGASALIKDLAMELAGSHGSTLLEERLEESLMRVACHSVIRGPKPLSREEGASILRKLAATDFSTYCPHGRPVVKRFSRKEVESFFRR